MKSKFIFHSALFSMFLFFTLNLHAQTEWFLAKSEQKIKVYTRNVTDSKIKEFKVQTTVKTSTKVLRELLLNFENYPKWIDGCVFGELVKKITNNNFIYHIKLDVPWPLKTREAFIEATISEEVNGSFTFKMTEYNSGFMVSEDNVRMTKFSGFWAFTPKENGFVEITQQIHAEPGGSIPSWLANSKVTDGPLATFVNLRKIAIK